MPVGKKSIWIAEPPDRDNLTGKSCIIADEYLCVWQLSPKYGWCYEITGVPDRSRILFHPGNLAGNIDLGYKTHTLGCQLPGLRMGRLQVKGVWQDAVLNSRAALGKIVAFTGKENFLLRIE